MTKRKRDLPELSPDEFAELAALRDELAAKYDEPKTKAISLVIRILGIEQARKVSEQADLVIASGGMMTIESPRCPGPPRPKTNGGIFLTLARYSMTDEQKIISRGRRGKPAAGN